MNIEAGRKKDNQWGKDKYEKRQGKDLQLICEHDIEQEYITVVN